MRRRERSIGCDVSPSIIRYESAGATTGMAAPLFSASNYTFTFEIFSRTGGANLTISNPWYSDVQYTGTLSQLY